MFGRKPAVLFSERPFLADLDTIDLDTIDHDTIDHDTIDHDDDFRFPDDHGRGGHRVLQ